MKATEAETDAAPRPDATVDRGGAGGSREASAEPPDAASHAASHASVAATSDAESDSATVSASGPVPDARPEAAPSAPDGPSAGGDAAPATIGSLSPSRAGDFMTCPLLYRFRVIDRIPERPSPAAVRGTLVHAVLERLFDLPAADRVPDAALGLLDPEWERLREEDPELAELFGDDDAQGAWLAEAQSMLRRYFTLEDPRRLEPARRELYVEAVLGSGLLLRGYIDRVDVAPTGEVRVVDYKTGRAPGEMFEARALFQMKFYALVLWRLHGTVPRLLQLIYLGNGEILCYSPDEADLRATERKVEALWRAIRRAMDTGDWRPRRSRVCDWCDHKERCPEFGGTPPPLPETVPAWVDSSRRTGPGGADTSQGRAVTDEAPSPRGPGDDL
jgi:putative RecB family exonuclease